MSVVIRAKKTLKSLELDSSIREWTQGALAELDQMKELRNLAMTFDINYPFEENIYELGNLAKLEHLEVLCFGIENKVSHHFSSLSRKLWENMFKHLKKLKALEIQIANESMVASIVGQNPDLKVIRILHWQNFNYVISFRKILELQNDYPEIDIGRSMSLIKYM